MRQPAPIQTRLARAQTWLSLIGYAVLVAGLSGSAWAYFRAGNDKVDATNEIMAGIQNTKSYQYNLEIQGGKASVAANNIGMWFAGLWQGRQLATTLAVLTIALALMCFLVAYILPDLPPFPPRHDAPKKAAPPDQPPTVP